MVSSWYLRGYIMATQSSYTTVKVSRFGFSVLSVTLDRVNTQDVKEVACSLIAAATKTIYDGDNEYIESKWDSSIKDENKYVSFVVDAGGSYENDYMVSIQHFDITEQQRINAVRADEAVSPMFL